MKIIKISHSVEETFETAFKIGKDAVKGTIITLSGDLGAGKTVMAKGIGAGIGVDEDITSPTFSLFEMYEGKLPFYHFDLYRIKNKDELENLHFDEYWYGKGVSVIEWPEIAKEALDGSLVSIKIEPIDNESRRITIEYPDN